MSEEEIIKNIKEMIQWSDHNTYKMALQGLLNLYKQNEESCTKYLAEIGQLRTKLHAEKEKNKELYEDNQKQWAERCKLAIELDNNTVSKDKIREFALSESQADTYNFKTISLDRLLEFLEEE